MVGIDRIWAGLVGQMQVILGANLSGFIGQLRIGMSVAPLKADRLSD